MHKWVRTSAKAAVLTAGFVALGAGVSFADSHPTTSGNGSALSGNQLVGNLDLPVNVTGNAVGAVGGVAGARSDDSGTAVVDHGDDGPHTSGNGSLLSGNQAVVDGDVPVNVSGNAVGAVLGTAGAAAQGTGSAVVEGDGGRHHMGDDTTSSGNGALASANQLVADLDVPANVSGNAVGAVAGVAGAAAQDTGSVVVEDHGGHGHDHHHAHKGGHDKGHDGYHRHHQAAPAGADSLLEWADLGRPLHISPDEVDAGPVLHQRAGDGGDDIMTSGNGSLLGGNQLVADLDVPANVSGNAVGAVGGVAGAASHDTGSIVVDDGDDDIMTSGNGSLLGGNQAVVDGDVPVNVSGNAVGAVLGTAGAASHDTGSAVIEGVGDDVRHTAHQHQAAETRPQSHGLPETSEVADRVTGELPLRNELPDPSGVLPLNAEVPGSQAVEGQLPADVPAPSEAPAELSGLPEAAAEKAQEADPVGAVGAVEEKVDTDLGL